MQLSFSAKGLTGKAKIDGKYISHSDYFLSYSHYEQEQKYGITIMFGAGEFKYRRRDEQYWFSAEIPESVTSNQSVTEPIKGSEWIGSLKHSAGPPTESRNEIRELTGLSIKFSSEKDPSSLRVSGRTLEAYTNRAKAWDYEISLELTREIANILKNMSSASEL